MNKWENNFREDYKHLKQPDIDEIVCWIKKYLIPIDNIGETDRQYEEGLPDKPVKDKRTEEDWMKIYDDLWKNAKDRYGTGNQIKDFIKEVVRYISDPASNDESIEGLAEKTYPTKTDLSDPNRKLHGSMNREYKRCFIEGFKAASKEQENDAVYWKKRCEAAEVVLKSFPREVLLDQAGEDYLEYEELKNKNL